MISIVAFNFCEDNEHTAKVLTERWFQTEDIGCKDAHDFLQIIGRKTDFISFDGKTVCVTKIETLMRLLPLIGDVCIIGKETTNLIALISLNVEYLQQIAKEKLVNLNDVIFAPPTAAAIKSHINRINLQLPPIEAIKNYSILPDAFSVESNEITPTRNIKRYHVIHLHSGTIDQLLKTQVK